ncbi:MAG: tRNA lysidine(34) synthetase TilS [Salinisphaera sp.]|nr:tRNA lysidine(34) synthetase TilS [Salinisphaera sp.]
MNARYVVAFSGGCDSTVLLHAVTRTHPGKLLAVHVCHHMQPHCQRWIAHCESTCRDWAVPLTVRSVDIPPHPPEGPEAAARKARYRALAQVMEPGDIVVTAHHADDQAETVLLQALRGAGVRGLAAMPARMQFGRGILARPLLRVPRRELFAYARDHGLGWVEDPSNRDRRVDRSYLRDAVWPALAARWPAAAATLGRVARHQAETATLLSDLAELDLAACAGDAGATLAIASLSRLGAARFDNAVRHWLAGLDLPMPDHRHLAQVRVQAVSARRDAQPCIVWADAEVRRYRDCLYAMRSLFPVPEQWHAPWRPPQALSLPTDCGWLRADPVTGTGLRADLHPLRVSLRQGGESLRLPGRAHRSSLSKLLQAARIPPWVRARMPLLWSGEQLVAVADRWLCDGCVAGSGQPGWRVRWRDAPAG